MATYYRWRKNQVSYSIELLGNASGVSIMSKVGSTETATLYYSKEADAVSSGAYGVQLKGNIQSVEILTKISSNQSYTLKSLGIPDGFYYFSMSTTTGKQVLYTYSANIYLDYSSTYDAVYFQVLPSSGNTIQQAYGSVSAGAFLSYVYAQTSSSYPNGGVKNGYYYDQRTTITSPTAPTNLTYPNPITTPTVTVSWDAATSNVPGVPVDHYLVQAVETYGPTVISEQEIQAPNTSAVFSIPPVYAGINITQVFFQVFAVDTNGKQTFSSGPNVNVYFSPTLTVPSLAMQGQPITVNWTAITGATSYTLQRKANTDTDWVQVYSGSDLTFTETVGSWTSVQYQVQAVFSSGAGGWATSESIPVDTANPLVISGTDGDLGMLTADIPYTVSSDTGNPITLTRTVNGQLIATLTIQNGLAYTIPVFDLPTGAGKIEITASVQSVLGAPITKTRTWTYSKQTPVFPEDAGIGVLAQQSQNALPITTAEAVRCPTNWGGSLDKALELMYDAVNSAVISVGSYEGSGTFGADNPNTLTINPAPQVVTIYGEGKTLVISSTDTSSPAYIDGTTVKWYSTISAAEQMNTDGATYNYVAVAKGVVS